MARQLEWVGGVEAEQAALAEDIERLEAQIEALKTSSAAPALPSTLPGSDGSGGGGGSGSEPASGGQGAAPFLLVAVLSVAGNRERRDAIRTTWKAAAPPEVRCAGGALAWGCAPASSSWQLLHPVFRDPA